MDAGAVYGIGMGKVMDYGTMTHDMDSLHTPLTHVKKILCMFGERSISVHIQYGSYFLIDGCFIRENHALTNSHDSP
jgi:hypothetical protein